MRRMGSLRAHVAIAISAAMIMATAAAQTPPQTTTSTQTTTTKSPFPSGPGRDALFKVCNDCHGPESVLGQIKTRAEWSKTLDEMAANGAQGTEEEWNSILEYLDKYYSLIMVNTAAAKDLASKLDVSQEIADAIVGIRADKGKFTSIEDLKKVPGLDAAKLDARKDRLIF
jgi:competence protein ComEA